jgi:hypothetical protein
MTTAQPSPLSESQFAVEREAFFTRHNAKQQKITDACTSATSSVEQASLELIDTLGLLKIGSPASALGMLANIETHIREAKRALESVAR